MPSEKRKILRLFLLLLSATFLMALFRTPVSAFHQSPNTEILVKLNPDVAGATVSAKRKSMDGLDSGFQEFATFTREGNLYKSGEINATNGTLDNCSSDTTKFIISVYRDAVRDAEPINSRVVRACDGFVTPDSSGVSSDDSTPLNIATSNLENGGLKGALKLKVEGETNPVPCDSAASSINITGPTDREVSLSGDGSFKELKLATGEYELAGTCVYLNSTSLSNPSVTLDFRIISFGDNGLAGLKISNSLSDVGTIIVNDYETVSATPTTDPDEINCQGGGLGGWIFCLIIDATQNVVSFAKDFIVGYLKSPPLTQTGNTANEALYNGWKNMRTLANALLVPVFFLIIFSQALSLNIDAYTVKKMLPRLIAAAILIQFSYFAVAILVDVTNVLGNGAGSLLTTTFTRGGTDLSINPGTFAGFLGIFTTLSFITVGLANFGAALGLLATLMIPLAMSVVGVLFTLVFRQLLIILLAISAPIAFAAWVLPNTEKLFKTWWSTLLKTLMMYPIITLLFGSGTILAGLITSGVNAQGAVGAGVLKDIMAIVAIILPLGAVPFTFKFAGGAIAMVGEQANKYGRLVTRDSQGKRRGWYQKQLDERKDRFDKSQAGKGWYGNPVGKAGKLLENPATPSFLKKLPGAKSLINSEANRQIKKAELLAELGETAEKLGLKPEAYQVASMLGAGYHTADGRKAFDLQQQAWANSSNVDHRAMAADMEKLRPMLDRHGSDAVAALGKVSMKGGVADLALAEEVLDMVPGLRGMTEGDDGVDRVLASGVRDGIKVDKATTKVNGQATSFVKVDAASGILNSVAKAYMDEGDVDTAAAQVSSVGYHGKAKNAIHMMDRLDTETGEVKSGLDDEKLVKTIYGSIIKVSDETLGSDVQLVHSMPTIEKMVIDGLKEPEGSIENQKAQEILGVLRSARTSPKVPPENKALVTRGIGNIGKAIGKDIGVTSPVGGAPRYDTPDEQRHQRDVANQGAQSGTASGNNTGGTQPIVTSSSASSSAAATNAPKFIPRDLPPNSPETVIDTDQPTSSPRQESARIRVTEAAQGTSGNEPLVGSQQGVGTRRQQAEAKATQASQGTSGQLERTFVGRQEAPPTVQEASPYYLEGDPDQKPLTYGQARNAIFNNSNNVVKKREGYESSPDVDS